jgi:hypothetical protein
MGLWAWIRGRKSTDAATSVVTTHTTSVDLDGSHQAVMRDGVEVDDSAQCRGVVDEIDHLAHEFLATGAAATGAAATGSGGMTVMSSTSVFVDGQAVSADDPRARERMAEAVAKLRAQGFDELADDLQRQLGAAPQAAAGSTSGDPRSAAPTDESPAGPADAPEAPSAPVPPAPPSGSV